MEETGKASAYRFKSPPSFAELERRFHLQLLSGTRTHNRSPSLIEGELAIQTVKIRHLSFDSAPVPPLEDSPSTSSGEEPKMEEHLRAESKSLCPVCSKGFNTDKAMFGHMRIHQDKGCKGSKKPSISKPKPKPKPKSKPRAKPVDIDRLLTDSWGLTGKRGRKRLLDKNSPEEIAASILIDMKSSSLEGAEKKRRIEESEPLDEKKHVCEMCNKSFPSHQALGGHRSSHRKEMKNVVVRERNGLHIGKTLESTKRKAKGGPHVCEICGISYPTGQQLGGHKRAHFKQDPGVITTEVPGDHGIDFADMALNAIHYS